MSTSELDQRPTDERQAYIYEAAMDNDKLPRFRWEELP